jgi:hypothetical protein
MTKEFDSKEALKLAGKLAAMADLVIHSSVLDLSKKTQWLLDALEEYNNYIFNHTK